MTDHLGTPPLPWAGDPDRTCPHCGEEAPNELLLRTNHAQDGGLTGREGICLAMDLTRGHVLDAIQQVLDARAEVASRQLQARPVRAAERALVRAEGTLRRSVAHAREVWPDPGWLIEVLTPLADPADPPE